VTNPVRKGQ